MTVSGLDVRLSCRCLTHTATTFLARPGTLAASLAGLRPPVAHRPPLATSRPAAQLWACRRTTRFAGSCSPSRAARTAPARRMTRPALDRNGWGGAIVSDGTTRLRFGEDLVSQTCAIVCKRGHCGSATVRHERLYASYIAGAVQSDALQDRRLPGAARNHAVRCGAVRCGVARCGAPVPSLLTCLIPIPQVECSTACACHRQLVRTWRPVM